jgi:hypothetical protein
VHISLKQVAEESRLVDLCNSVSFLQGGLNIAGYFIDGSSANSPVVVRQSDLNATV